jgi:hypothetical protein
MASVTITPSMAPLRDSEKIARPFSTRRPLPEPPHLQQIPPELLDRMMAEHLQMLDARQDAIAARIQASRATSRK